MAYDSLAREGLAADWPRVLQVQMQSQAFGFVLASTIGAAIYYPDLMNAAAGLVGLDWAPTQQVTLRFPLVLCLLMAVGALASVWAMKERYIRYDLALGLT